MLLLCAPGFAEELEDFTSFSFLDNKQVDTAEMRGNILVMVFGSIYCKPCVELLPVMDVLYDKYRHADVKILLIDIDMAVDPELQREFVQHHAIKAPYIINALEIARNNKVYMLPTTLIVNRKGEVITRIYGFKKLSKFEKVIKKLHPVIAVPEVDSQPEDQVDNQTGLQESVSPDRHHDVHKKPHSDVREMEQIPSSHSAGEV
jgi:thiol-disulfide isomerase/thioredoxin